MLAENTKLSPTDDDQIVWGAEAIAEAIGRKGDAPAVFRLLERGHLPPAKKIGRRWCASRRKLVELCGGAA